MTLERRLREQLGAEAARLDEPADRLQRVVQRGRRRRLVQNATVGLTAIAVVVGAGAGLRSMTTTRVAFEPGATPSAIATSAPASPAATLEPQPTSSPTAEPGEDLATVRIADLGAPVLAYNPGVSGPNVPGLTLHRSGGSLQVWSETVGHVVVHEGGVIFESGRRLIWIRDVEAPQPLTILEADTAVSLRGMLPDGRVLYSTFQDSEDPEGALEHFFAVPLAVGSEPELITSEPAHEAWTVGPATNADGDLVMASCHMVCSLYSWPDEDDAAPFADPVYNGGGDAQGPSAAIEAIDATPDGTVLALAEYVPTEGIRPPEVALLDGTSMRELARIPLPLDDSVSRFSISVSADGQRVLALLHPYASGGEGGEGVVLPPEAFLIDQALSDTPRIRRLAFTGGVVQWFD